jgi:hypothetical protein
MGDLSQCPPPRATTNRDELTPLGGSRGGAELEVLSAVAASLLVELVAFTRTRPAALGILSLRQEANGEAVVRRNRRLV